MLMHLMYPVYQQAVPDNTVYKLKCLPLNVFKQYQDLSKHSCMHFTLLFFYNATHFQPMKNLLFIHPWAIVKISKTVIATLFVPRRVRTWMVKRTTSPFNLLICSNVANKLHWLLFYCGLVKSDLRESGKPISQRWSMFQDKTLLFKPELN